MCGREHPEWKSGSDGMFHYNIFLVKGNFYMMVNRRLTEFNEPSGCMCGFVMKVGSLAHGWQLSEQCSW